MKATQYVTSKEMFLQKKELASTVVETTGAVRVKISDTVSKTPIKGFGAAITGSSCYELNKMDKVVRKQFLEDIYGDNGLGLSVGRLTIGSSDYSEELYSYDDVENDIELKHFSIEKDEKYIVPMIKEIQDINPDIYLYASPWSPPGWMKTEGTMCGGYMCEEYIQCYAEYIVKYLKAYQEHGIDVRAITPQNECETHQDGRMPACIWHPDIEAKFIIELRRLLEENNMDTGIWMYDHNFSGWKRVLCMLKKYPELMKASGTVAFHYYSGSIEMTDAIKREFPDIKMEYTEGGPRLYDNYDTDWCKWGSMLSKCINHEYGSFCGWNLLLDEFGRPHLGLFACGGLTTLNSVTGELSYSGQYKALAHFSKFIKSGAKACSLEIDGTGMNMFGYPYQELPVECCAVRNLDGSVVVQFVNPSNFRKQVQCILNGEMWYIDAISDSITTVVFED